MASQLVDYSIPQEALRELPHPHNIFAPFMPSTTNESKRYMEWEASVISGFLAVQPDPSTPDTRETQSLAKKALDRYEWRLKAVFSSSSRVNDLSQGEKAHVTGLVAEALVWSKILACRLFNINQLPVEVLSLILDMAATQSGSSTNMMHARLPLSAVCRRWRSTVIGNQYLWSAIVIDDAPRFERTFQYMERAGSAYLQLRIVEPAKPRVSEVRVLTSEDMERLMERVLPKLGQVSSLIVILKSSSPILTLLALLHQTPLLPEGLERLEIHHPGELYGTESAPRLTWDGSEHAFTLCNDRLPALRVLTLNGIHAAWPAIQIRNLTSLDLRHIYPSFAPTIYDLRSIFQRSPTLDTLHIFSMKSAPSAVNAVSLDPISLPRLRVFAFGGFPIGLCLDLIRSLLAPAVVDLSVHSHVSWARECAPVFDALASMFPEVRILRFTNFSERPSPLADVTRAITRWLATMPRVEVLRFTRMESHFFQFFLADSRYFLGNSSTPPTHDAFQDTHPDPQWVLPRLRCVVANHVKMNDLRLFVDRRAIVGYPLEQLYVRSDWFYADKLDRNVRSRIENADSVNETARDAITAKVDVALLNPADLAHGRVNEEARIWKEVYGDGTDVLK